VSGAENGAKLAEKNGWSGGESGAGVAEKGGE